MYNLVCIRFNKRLQLVYKGLLIKNPLILQGVLKRFLAEPLLIFREPNRKYHVPEPKTNCRIAISHSFFADATSEFQKGSMEFMGRRPAARC